MRVAGSMLEEAVVTPAKKAEPERVPIMRGQVNISTPPKVGDTVLFNNHSWTHLLTHCQKFRTAGRSSSMIICCSMGRCHFHS